MPSEAKSRRITVTNSHLMLRAELENGVGRGCRFTPVHAGSRRVTPSRTGSQPQHRSGDVGRHSPIAGGGEPAVHPHKTQKLQVGDGPRRRQEAQ